MRVLRKEIWWQSGAGDRDAGSLLPLASMKRRSPKPYGVRGFPLAAILTFFCLAVNEKDFSHSLEMTKAGSSIPVSKAIFMGSL